MSESEWEEEIEGNFAVHKAVTNGEDVPVPSKGFELMKDLKHSLAKRNPDYLGRVLWYIRLDENREDFCDSAGWTFHEILSKGIRPKVLST